jgi:hypothetical protein
VVAYDPEAIETTRNVLGEGNLASGSLSYAADPYSALVRADALVIATEWPEFRRPDFERMQRLLNAPVIFDGRNLYQTERMAEAGFVYHSIGRPFVPPAEPSEEGDGGLRMGQQEATAAPPSPTPPSSSISHPLFSIPPACPAPSSPAAPDSLAPTSATGSSPRATTSSAWTTS